MVKMVGTFRAFLSSRFWGRANGGQMGGLEGKHENGANGQMGQMEGKWAGKWRKYGKGNDLAGMGQMESVCLDIRSHLSHRLMPRTGESSGNK